MRSTRLFIPISLAIPKKWKEPKAVFILQYNRATIAMLRVCLTTDDGASFTTKEMSLKAYKKWEDRFYQGLDRLKKGLLPKIREDESDTYAYMWFHSNHTSKETTWVRVYYGPHDGFIIGGCMPSYERVKTLVRLA